MRTVAFLRAELEKFPDDAICFAYEGEVTGIVIEPPLGPSGERDLSRSGVIFCSEDDDYDVSNETRMIRP